MDRIDIKIEISEGTEHVWLDLFYISEDLLSSSSTERLEALINNRAEYFNKALIALIKSRKEEEND